MAGSLIISSIQLDSDNNFSILSNTGTTLVSANGSGIIGGIADGSITPAKITGTLTVSQGGTGANTLTANNVILGNGTNTVQFVAPGTTGNVLTSNGTTWASAAIPAQGFAAGTRMIFAQDAAPTGWTKDTTNYNNHALRVVTGTAGTTGGTVDFTTAFASQAVTGSVGTSGATTLSESQIPSHTHSLPAVSGCGGSQGLGVTISAASSQTSGATGGGGSHTHSGGTFTGTAINLAVKYLNVITATKN